MARNPFGSRYDDAHVSKIEFPKEECEKICKWINEPKNMLVIIGNPGLGKTYICAALYNFLVEKKIEQFNIRSFSEKQFFQQLHKIIENDWDYLAEVERICESKYIFMDDILTKTTPSDWQKEVLFHFLDLRYSSEYPTIITSNVWLHVMSQIMGSRFVSRIEDKKNTVIEMNWIDKRQDDRNNNTSKT